MIIVMRAHAPEEQIQNVIKHVEDAGFEVHLSRGVERTIIGVKGVSHDALTQPFESLKGVDEVIRVLKPYKLASREFHPDNTQVKVKDVIFGGNTLVIGAGPCSIEGEDMYRDISQAVKASGATLLRGGAFKPRSSPYSFQGMGEEGLKIMRAVGNETGLPIQTEATNPRSLQLVAKYADIIQIGARNMQNYDLLKEAGQTGMPILLKRGMAASTKDLLLSAEYIMSEGNDQVILCERGIRTFETATRNTLDISAIPVLKENTHLPVMVDPSHASGHMQYIQALSLAAIAGGCDGLLIEVHNNPEIAKSDGEQSLLPEQFADLMEQAKKVAAAIGRDI
ncbi:MAG: 3-deoxy-7-phosphoheptulonate synthase [Planctomycetes bacterium]|nr:3-deoxy-7-phosphoheptulonate synthase [Planctomycetota bacterium]